jgi:gephyrin
MSCNCSSSESSGNPLNSSPWPMLAMDQAMHTVIQQAKLAAIQENGQNIMSISIVDSLNHFAAETIQSQQDFPTFAASFMDGYAFNVANNNTENTNNCYRIVGADITAGIVASKDFKLAENECAYITTGSMLPNTANAVQMVEFTQQCQNLAHEHPANARYIQILRSVRLNENVRAPGSDLKRGDTVLQQYSQITAADIGLLASLGITQIRVFKPVTVGILSTGSELVDFTAQLSNPAQIRDSNRVTLISACKSLNFPVNIIDLGCNSDEKSVLRAKIMEALQQVDVLITTGGVSMGKLDLIKPILAEIPSVSVHFGRLNMKPGKPATFATYLAPNQARKLIFSLPGNPVSAFVCFYLLVRPALSILLGNLTVSSHNCHEFLRVTAVEKFNLGSRPEFVRVVAGFDAESGEILAISAGNQQSSRILSTVRVNALLVLPGATESKKFLAAGSKIDAILIGPLNLLSQEQLNSMKLGLKNNKNHPIHSNTHGHHHHGRTTSTSHSNSAEDRSETASTAASAPNRTPNPVPIRVNILTVSDRVAAGISEDKSGPNLAQFVRSAPWSSSISVSLGELAVVADEIKEIQAKIIAWSENSPNSADLILTTGGTGFSPRDITPEAVRPLLTKLATGLEFAINSASAAATPFALLSRPVAGVRGNSLILTLPGNPKAGPEILTALLPILPHALKLLKNFDDPHTGNKQ